ncbi:hypothetical protein KC19_8G155200 [Ceratodon purpureus]|uniref:Uncharacterized protein n=1 Tax=Ceratodon purpureus TaxID=3225 RepID=A0A8T0H3Q8_CERPU|nr:hypothetical protein KC19_8G155200 [Ceratodon purpureus]
MSFRQLDSVSLSLSFLTLTTLYNLQQCGGCGDALKNSVFVISAVKLVVRTHC